MKIDIIYENDDLLIVNKPAGLLVIPDRFNNELPSLNKLLEKQLGQRVYVVHRLDRDTSGVICFAKTEEAHKHLSDQFQNHKAEKYYTGLVNGRVLQQEGSIDSPITYHPSNNGAMVIHKKGKESLTDYAIAEQWPLYTLLNFRIHTGRTHQIRVHMQSIGHPIVCDELYGDGKPFYLSNIKKKYNHSLKKDERPLLSRLALHARNLVIAGMDGTTITAEAPLPKDINACVTQLNKWSVAV